MYGEFNGGISLTDEEKHWKIKLYEKPFWGVGKRYNELNSINNDELGNAAIKYHSIS